MWLSYELERIDNIEKYGNEFHMKIFISWNLLIFCVVKLFVLVHTANLLQRRGNSKLTIFGETGSKVLLDSRFFYADNSKTADFELRRRCSKWKNCVSCFRRRQPESMFASNEPFFEQKLRTKLLLYIKKIERILWLSINKRTKYGIIILLTSRLKNSPKLPYSRSVKVAGLLNVINLFHES